MGKVAFIIYLVTLILSPLLFGAVHVYAYTLMTLGVLTASIFLLVKTVEKDPKSGILQFRLPRTGLDFLFLALLAFLIFQIIPLPDFFLNALSPMAGEVGRKSLPASVASTLDSPIRAWFSLSPYRYPVRMSLIRWKEDKDLQVSHHKCVRGRVFIQAGHRFGSKSESFRGVPAKNQPGRAAPVHQCDTGTNVHSGPKTSSRCHEKKVQKIGARLYAAA